MPMTVYDFASLRGMTPVQCDRAADDLWIAAELLLPEAMTQDRHRSAPRRIARVEHAPDERRPRRPS